MSMNLIGSFTFHTFLRMLTLYSFDAIKNSSLMFVISIVHFVGKNLRSSSNAENSFIVCAETNLDYSSQNDVSDKNYAREK